MSEWVKKIPCGFKLLTAFLCLVLIFGLLYHMGHALRFASAEEGQASTPDFWCALYFSMVTISSLGYGDVLPIGGWRFAAGVEVLMGLGLFGVLVSHFASRENDSILRQLKESDIANNVLDFARELQPLLDEWWQALGTMDGDQSNRQRYRFGEYENSYTIYLNMRELARDIDEYIRSESSGPCIFGMQLERSLLIVLKRVNTFLSPVTTQQIPEWVRQCISAHNNSNDFLGMLDIYSRLAEHLSPKAHGRLLSTLGKLKQLCEEARTSLSPDGWIAK